jgi:large subunit ribosomal protein L6
VSRVGKKPISIPNGVNVTIQSTNIIVKGPKGELSWNFPNDLAIIQEQNTLQVNRPSDSKNHKSLHGLTRVLIANMIQGVSAGFEKAVEIEGVGYSAELVGKSLLLNLGLSHPVLIAPPAGITFEIPKNLVVKIKGIDKQKVGQIAAKIRSIKPVEPYKGKGIRYQGEYVRRKAGKKIGVK